MRRRQEEPLDRRTTEQQQHDDDFWLGEIDRPSTDLKAEAGLDTWTDDPQ